jgi:PAS domain S-box-containing protein
MTDKDPNDSSGNLRSEERYEAACQQLEVANQQLHQAHQQLEVVNQQLQAEDITKQLQAREALATSEERLKLVIKGSNDAPWDWDLTTNELYYSPQWWSQLGLAPDELQADAALWQRLMHPDDAARVDDVFGGAMQKGLESYEVEVRLRHKEGHYVPVLSRGFISRDQSGVPTRVTGSNMDLSERKRVEEALRSSEERIRSILDATPFPVAVVDQQDDQIRYWSRSALDLFGHTAPTAAGWYELAYPDTEYRRQVIERWKTALDRQRGSRGAVNTGEYEVTCRDGSVRTCELYASFLDDSMIVTFNDITDRKAIEAQLIQADRLSSLGTLAAGVAHEINNPLSYVLSNLEGLTEELPAVLGSLRRMQQHPARSSDADRAAAVFAERAEAVDPLVLDGIMSRFQDALEGTHRIRDVTRGLGVFSRVEADKLVPVDLRSVFEAARNMTHNEIKYRARLVEDFSMVPPVLASEGRLSQVFLNLIINAAHALDEGMVEQNEIRLSTWSEDRVVCAEVRDSGSGIPREHLGRIFEPFFTTKQVGAGSGLGLAISRRIIEDYKGTISVESELGKGSTFTVRLPIHEVEKKATGATLEAGTVASGRGRILIIDDEPSIRRTMVRMLRQHETVQVASGLEAKRLLEQDQDFDLILCDMMMPDLSGMDLHTWLVAEHPRLARDLIFITGGAFTPRALEYLARVDNLRLDKPFNVATLMQLVNEQVARSKRTQPR